MESYEEFSSMDGSLRVSQNKLVLQRKGLRKFRSLAFNRTAKGFKSNFDEIDKVRIYNSLSHVVFEFYIGEEKHKIRFLEKSESNMINDGEQKISKLKDILDEKVEVENNYGESNNPIINYFRSPFDLQKD